MATGAKFQDVNNPKVAVQVGQIGDVGVIEIQDMMFTVSGPTAGAVLVEWNVYEISQGSVGLWGMLAGFFHEGYTKFSRFSYSGWWRYRLRPTDDTMSQIYNSRGAKLYSSFTTISYDAEVIRLSRKLMDVGCGPRYGHCYPRSDQYLLGSTPSY